MLASAQAHIVLDNNSAPIRKGHTMPPTFRPMYIVAKRLDGSKVDLGPGDIVLDGTELPPTERGTAAPTLRSTLL